MSENQERMPYQEAMAYAITMVNILRPLCSRIGIAGSLRRKKETIGDIEIVLILKPEFDMFGAPVESSDSGIVDSLTKSGFKFIKNGKKYKQVSFYNGVPVDLFITTPEQWGCIFLIRTGSADFSKKVVTKDYLGGWCPENYDFKDGRILNGVFVLDTPEEEDVFRALDLDYVKPEDRNG